MRPSVLIVINSLHSGGAEKTCIDLARHLKDDYTLHVVSLVIGGPAEDELRAMGVQVTVLSADSVPQRLKSLFWLARLIRREQPDVVVTFLYIADFVGGILTRVLAPRAKIYWNVRNNVLGRRQSGTVSYVVSRFNGALSGFIPDRVIYCSPTAQTQHEAIGFRCADSLAIENSPQAVPFSFAPDKRQSFRQRFGGDAFTFLFVGRFDRIKRVDLYVDACAEIGRRCGERVQFALAGRGMERENAWLSKYIDASGRQQQFHLLGHVLDQQALFSGADCLVVTSESEGSPNAVYEAMATRLPVIIFGTIGTEHIQGAGVQRIPSRTMDLLTAAMERAVECGIPAQSSRLSPIGADASVLHPLVAFYKTLLSA